MEDANYLKTIETTSVSIMHHNDQSHGELEDRIDVAPLSRLSIDKTDLSTPDQDIFIDTEDSTNEQVENNDDPETVLISVDQDVINEFEHAFDNCTCKEIINHTISEDILLFEILTVDGTKLSLPCTVLKQDHPYNCAKFMNSCVIEGRRSSLQPHNVWAKNFLIQHKRNIRQFAPIGYHPTLNLPTHNAIL